MARIDEARARFTPGPLPFEGQPDPPPEPITENRATLEWSDPWDDPDGPARMGFAVGEVAVIGIDLAHRPPKSFAGMFPPGVLARIQSGEITGFSIGGRAHGRTLARKLAAGMDRLGRAAAAAGVSMGEVARGLSALGDAYGGTMEAAAALSEEMEAFMAAPAPTGGGEGGTKKQPRPPSRLDLRRPRPPREPAAARAKRVSRATWGCARRG